MNKNEMRPLVTEMRIIAIDERLKETLVRAIDETVSAKYDLHVRDSLHLKLLARSTVQNDAFAYSLKTLIPVFEENFGSHARPLSRDIGKRLFSHLQLEFPEKRCWDLCDYVKNARAALLERESREVRS
jgi:hypothetical protein